MNDPGFECMTIQKIYIQVPGESPVRFFGEAIPNKNDVYIVDGVEYYVGSRIFDSKNKSCIIPLEPMR